MLSWDNVAPGKRVILSKRICPVPLATPLPCSSIQTTLPSTPHQRVTSPPVKRYQPTPEKIPPDKLRGTTTEKYSGWKNLSKIF